MPPSKPMSRIFESLALACRKHTVADYRLMLPIGILDAEHGRLQEVLFTVDVWTALPQAPDPAGKTAFWDYTAIVRAIDAAAAARAHTALQEDLHEAVFASLFADSRVCAARVLTQKTAAWSNARAAAVETFRLNAHAALRLDRPT